MPRIILIHKDDELATCYAIFVGDIHPSGHDQKGGKHTKCACKQLMSRMNSRGNQTDDKKYHEASLVER